MEKGYRLNPDPENLAAQVAARTPKPNAKEIRSFRCRHDAVLFRAIQGINENSGTPFFSFRDLDENKPSGSIKIRVETIDYFLKRYREGLTGGASR